MPDKKIWTLEAFSIYCEAIRIADEKFRTERDRRYTEVNIEKDKALQIKQKADEEALKLARESQAYKDQQTDQMREKTLTSSGIYATHADVALVAEKMGKSINQVAERMEAALEPLAKYVATQQGSAQGTTLTKGNMYAMITAVTAIIVAAIYLMK